MDKEGPIKPVIKELVSKEPKPLGIPGFQWVTVDIENAEEVNYRRSNYSVPANVSQIKEVYKLLSNHYVEDDEAMFRFNYSETFLNW